MASCRLNFTRNGSDGVLSSARVPTPNAYELYQGLQDVGVPVKLIIYKGFNHGLNKPKAARAAMEHNFEWFNRYVWGAKQSGTR